MDKNSIKTINNNNHKFTIRIPIRMFQLTETDGTAWPISFDWENSDGKKVEVAIDRVFSVTKEAELKSGAVGDRYDCEIEGKREYLYYTKLAPRKWFKIEEVTEAEYNSYYKLVGE